MNENFYISYDKKCFLHQNDVGASILQVNKWSRFESFCKVSFRDSRGELIFTLFEIKIIYAFLDRVRLKY